MRTLGVAAILLGCGHSDGPPDAMCSGPASTVYIARTGGTYAPGEVDDSRANASTIVPSPHTFAAYDSPNWPMARDCIVQQLAPFHIAVTETDPGSAPHVEIVLSPADASEIGLSGGSTAASATSCHLAPNAIAFVWPHSSSDDPTVICELVAYAVGEAGGLEPTTACEDAMSLKIGIPQCGGPFRDVALPCSGPSSACHCDSGTTQNSFEKMAAAYGRCP